MSGENLKIPHRFSFVIFCLFCVFSLFLSNTSVASDFIHRPGYYSEPGGIPNGIRIIRDSTRPLIVVGLDSKGRRVALIFPPGKNKPSKIIDIDRMERVSAEVANYLPRFSNNSGDKFKKEILEASKKYHVSVSIIEAVIHQESGYNPRVVSKTGAKGLMQLMPGTAEDMGVQSVFDPHQNIDGGVKYLAYMLSQFGDLRLALAAYNAGPAAVIKYRGIPPFKETQNYVSSIMGRLR